MTNEPLSNSGPKPKLWTATTEPPYRCWHCGYGWDTEPDLITHLQWLERSHPLAY